MKRPLFAVRLKVASAWVARSSLATPPFSPYLQALIALVLLAGVLGCARQVTVTIAIAPVGNGMVTSPAGQCLGPSCVVQVDEGSTVALTAEPRRTAPMSTFAGWGGFCRGPNSDCKFTANQSLTAIAYFRSAAKQVAVGGHHTCVLRPAGDVVCWGRNSSGQVGNDSTAANLDVSPVKFGGGTLRNVVQIATGGYHSCALDATGQVWCWGSNQEGALGFGTDAQSLHAVQVKNIAGALAITAGGHHSCAVLSNRTAVCWGSNGWGQLGDLTRNHSNTPVMVSGVTGIVALAAGAYHTCALRTDATIVCWGANDDGQLGVGVRGPSVNYPPGSPVLTLSTGDTPGPALMAVSIAASIGLGWEGTSVLGGYHSCAIGTDQKAYCWGNNNFGQVAGLEIPGVNLLGGDVQTLARERFIFEGDPEPLPPAKMVAAGAYHTCTVKEMEHVEEIADRRHVPPEEVADPRHAPPDVRIAARGVECWGDNASWQRGDQGIGSSTRLTGVLDLAAGGYHTCAVVGPSAPGTVSCWGWNADGQVTGTPGPNVTTPTTLPGP